MVQLDHFSAGGVHGLQDQRADLRRNGSRCVVRPDRPELGRRGHHRWDPAGNLTSWQDLRQGLNESFTYDALDRLTLAAGPGAQSTSLAYDSIGNLQSKTGVGSYTYHPTRRHAVTSAGGVSDGYDANGNMTSRGGATIAWSSYNLPTVINAPGA